MQAPLHLLQPSVHVMHGPPLLLGARQLRCCGSDGGRAALPFPPLQLRDGGALGMHFIEQKLQDGLRAKGRGGGGSLSAAAATAAAAAGGNQLPLDACEVRLSLSPDLQRALEEQGLREEGEELVRAGAARRQPLRA